MRVGRSSMPWKRKAATALVRFHMLEALPPPPRVDALNPQIIHRFPRRGFSISRWTRSSTSREPETYFDRSEPQHWHGLPSGISYGRLCGSGPTLATSHANSASLAIARGSVFSPRISFVNAKCLQTRRQCDGVPKRTPSHGWEQVKHP
jgi:uncharacterized protein YciI